VRTAIILAGGDGAPTTALPDADIVIAADGGLALASPLGLTTDLVVGDMDSVDLDLLSAAEREGVEVRRHPTDKDATDLELALDAAMAAGATAVTVVGGGGGRLDHLLANAALIASERYRKLAVDWRVGADVVTVVRAGHTISGRPGDLVTLLAVGGPAVVTTTGLRWQLDRATLEAGTTRGVSNQLTASPATVAVEEGVLLVITRSGG
jgi:thiamine pyrophosphokinase